MLQHIVNAMLKFTQVQTSICLALPAGWGRVIITFSFLFSLEILRYFVRVGFLTIR